MTRTSYGFGTTLHDTTFEVAEEAEERLRRVVAALAGKEKA